MARPGARNLITDTPGLLVGQAEDASARTGVTVLYPEARAVCAVDVRGGGPGTRETDALAPDTLVEAVDALVLAGGSVYGLAAADGVAAALGARGRGFALTAQEGVPPSPVTPAAILFDLANGGRKDWGESPPYRDLGKAALAAAGEDFELGNAGAGYGAAAGTLKGGTGSASLVTDQGVTVGALACVNSFGSVTRPDGAFWAAPFEIGAEYGGRPPGPDRLPPGDWTGTKLDPNARENTTLAVIATDAVLTPAQARRVAVMAQDGLARAIRPVHTPFDGDVVFVLSTARQALADPAPLSLAQLGAAAADTLARAVARGVYEAQSLGGMRGWRDLHS